MPPPPESLRIALLAYRGNPFSGGQGVYVRHLSRALTALGHRVTVFGGQPYPDVDPEVQLVRLPSLNLYRSPDPFRVPRLREYSDAIDVLEFGMMCTAAFPEPLTFSLRARREFRRRAGGFDIVHDNQGLGYGLLGIRRMGLPVIATIHHAVEIDRRVQLETERTIRKQFAFRRWYGFARMQARVARSLPRIVTVSNIARDDIVRETGVRAERVSVVANGVDAAMFRPDQSIARAAGRVITTASADVPLKGLVYLLEAIAKLRTERSEVHLVVVGRPRSDSTIPETIERLGLDGAVSFEGGIDDRGLAGLYAGAEVAVVPSLYEGFSLPAIEAMACGVPLVATTGGALPEVTGADGETAVHVPPADAGALAAAIAGLLDRPDLRERIGAAGRARVLERFTWRQTAEATTALYQQVIGASRN